MKLRKITLWQSLAFISILVLFAFTLAVWRAQRRGGACNEQHNARTKSSGSPAGKNDTDPGTYPCRLISPENLPTDYLVIIGVGGVFVAISTLKSIHHQAVQVRKQTKILRTSADAAKASAEAALRNIDLYVSKERASLRVNVQPLDLSKKEWGVPRVDFSVTNAGPTQAFVLRSGVASGIIPLANVDEPDVWGGAMSPIISLPREIATQKPLTDCFAILELPEGINVAH